MQHVWFQSNKQYFFTLISSTAYPLCVCCFPHEKEGVIVSRWKNQVDPASHVAPSTAITALMNDSHTRHTNLCCWVIDFDDIVVAPLQGKNSDLSPAGACRDEFSQYVTDITHSSLFLDSVCVPKPYSKKVA